MLCVVCFFGFFSFFSFFFQVLRRHVTRLLQNFKTLNFVSGFTRLSNLATLFVCVILEVPQLYFTRIEKSPSTW